MQGTAARLSVLLLLVALSTGARCTDSPLPTIHESSGSEMSHPKKLFKSIRRMRYEKRKKPLVPDRKVKSHNVWVFNPKSILPDMRDNFVRFYGGGEPCCLETLLPLQQLEFPPGESIKTLNARYASMLQKMSRLDENIVTPSLRPNVTINPRTTIVLVDFLSFIDNSYAHLLTSKRYHGENPWNIVFYKLACGCSLGARYADRICMFDIIESSFQSCDKWSSFSYAEHGLCNCVTRYIKLINTFDVFINAILACLPKDFFFLGERMKIRYATLGSSINRVALPSLEGDNHYWKRYKKGPLDMDAVETKDPEADTRFNEFHSLIEWLVPVTDFNSTPGMLCCSQNLKQNHSATRNSCKGEIADLKNPPFKKAPEVSLDFIRPKDSHPCIPSHNTDLPMAFSGLHVTSTEDCDLGCTFYDSATKSTVNIPLFEIKVVCGSHLGQSNLKCQPGNLSRFPCRSVPV